nr:immunoglobulin light chain junction region [Macaca mulatta]MOX87941.1 immunoglobulin light chain junction region [Macaca mulatta]
CQQHNKYPWTF